MASVAALRFGKHLKELRIHLCQTSPASKGVRDFMENDYVPLKKQNLELPILVRECSGTRARAFARYELGEERSVALADLSSDQVMAAIRDLAQKP